MNAADFSGMSAKRTVSGLPVAHIALGALRANWRHLAFLAKGVPPLAIVKADAYGHGILPVTSALLEEGCRFFAVGSIAEGILLREFLAAKGAGDVPVLPLLGIMTREDVQMCVAYNLLPLVHSAWQLPLLASAHVNGKSLPVALKAETGMSRLGMRDTALLSAVRQTANLEPRLLLSHFAASDDPGQHDSVAAQLVRFLSVFSAARAIWPDITPSIANSAACLLQDELLRDLPVHLGRPGYALYGGNPLAGTAYEERGKGLEPVMAVTAPVLAVHDLVKGATVSYGRTFTAPSAMRVAVVGAGYSDGLPRGLSDKGRVCVRGISCPILGRVCMQMHMIDVTEVSDASPGDDAFLLGGVGPGAVGMEELAKTWGTIPYEVFCSLGRNNRKYTE